jgi:octaprenyl-diphosphate synthase
LNIIQDIHKYLGLEITSVNQIIVSHLAGRDELIKLIGNHLISSGGKRIRPIITILTSKMFGADRPEDVLKLSTAIEFIHAATLLHDDVVDGSSMRRFKPTANFIWGNKPSILVGDFLLSQAFKLMVEVGEPTALKSLSRAAAILIEGEVSQLTILARGAMISQGEYDQVITAKTAELFASASEIGGILSLQSPETCKILKDFGLIVGKIFQITDDLLDYLGTKELIGKNIGDDFLEGKVTLPLILLYEKLGAPEKLKLEEFIKKQERSSEEFEYIQDLLKQYRIEKQILNYLQELKTQGYKLINQVEPKVEICKDYLMRLVEFTINRNF